MSNLLRAVWEVYLITSPYVVLGLAAAGLLHVLIPAERIARWLGGSGLGSTARAACLGIPLPLCSCAVVPVTIELSRKGASREASLAFLVSTPETGVDSILVTYGLMGPVMAVVRPLAALLTSLVAGATSMLWREGTERSGTAAGDESELEPPNPGSAPTPAAASQRLRAGSRYAFVEMVDEIGFWLVTGLILTGVIAALVPEALVQRTIGEGLRSMVLLLLLGVPMYMCASASTPVAAALLLKGVSPGAALVFLLAGPATNAASLVVIARFFGRRFVAIYLSSVVASSLLAGWAFDALLGRVDLAVDATISTAASEQAGAPTYAAAALLGLLLLASLARGAWKRAVREFLADLGNWRRLLSVRSGARD